MDKVTYTFKILNKHDSLCALQEALKMAEDRYCSEYESEYEPLNMEARILTTGMLWFSDIEQTMIHDVVVFVHY